MSFLQIFSFVTGGSCLGASDVAILTAGSLASNAAWAWLGDRFDKLRLLEGVGVLRLAPPIGALLLLTGCGLSGDLRLTAFALLFVAVGALVNGMIISYLGYLMEISPDDRRPACSAYFNALASPAALVPLLGAGIADLISLEAVFALAIAAAAIQLVLLRKLKTPGES